MRRLETARRILGKGKLAADINAAWTPMQVLAARKDFARVGLDWLEEPVRFEDREGCRMLVREMPGISLMGFETEQGLSNFTHLVEDQMVDIVQPEDLFKCDVFVFVASKGIPPVGSGVKDVRMYQFENNSKIVSQYARQARKEQFKGLFAVVSDPVDPLAKAAYLASNTDEKREF